jgi:hypothetical protein
MDAEHDRLSEKTLNMDHQLLGRGRPAGAETTPELLSVPHRDALGKYPPDT